MLQPFSQAVKRLYFVDAKGSGLVMYQDQIGLSYSAKKTLIPGRMTAAAILAETDIVRTPGAQLLATDTGALYESTAGAWSLSVSGVQQLEEQVSITGVPGGTNTLRVSIGFAYSGNPTYQWTRDNVNIAGATAATYTQDPLVDAQKEISCVVSGIVAKYSAVKILIPGVAPVQLTGNPTTSGQTTGFQNFSVTASQGQAPYTYSLVNAPNGMSVDSAGVVSYPNPVVGTYTGIIVRVTDALNTVASITFNLSVTQGGIAPTNTILPAVTGTAQVGQTLSVSTGTWTNSPTSYSYQWKANGAAISGAADQNTYVIQQAQLNQAITCTVIASNGLTASATSNATAAVIAASVASTKPRFGYAPANASNDAAIFDTLFPTMTELTGSANAGKAGTFNTVQSNTNYVWLAVLQSAVGSGLHVFDGTGNGGFDGANSAGNFTGVDADPMGIFKTYVTGGNTWNLYRSDYKAANFGPFTLS